MNAQFHPAWTGRCSRIALALAASVPALSGQVSGPTQGHVFDAPSKSLRLVAGSFGAASLGAVLADGLDFASVAPQRSFGIGCAAGQCFVLSGLGSAESRQTPLPEPAAMATGAAWSPDGKTVALYSDREEWIRVVRGLPDAADAQPQWNTRSLGHIGSVAVSAEQVVLAITEGHPGVFEVTETGNFVPVLQGVNPMAMGFAADGKTLLIADSVAHTISEVSLTTGLVQSWPIDAVQQAAGIQVGRDAAGLPVVYVADEASKALFVYSATTHALTDQIELAFHPTQLEPVGTGSFQLTSRAKDGDLVWAYTPGRGVYFVPVTPVPATEEAESTGLAQRRVRR